jgi:hypothetical protein
MLPSPHAQERPAYLSSGAGTSLCLIRRGPTCERWRADEAVPDGTAPVSVAPLCPDNHECAGKRKSRKSRDGNNSLERTHGDRLQRTVKRLERLMLPVSLEPVTRATPERISRNLHSSTGFSSLLSPISPGQRGVRRPYVAPVLNSWHTPCHPFGPA